MYSVLPKDSRNFFMVPQAHEGGGYYTYGRPSGGAYQFAHPVLLTLLLRVASEWCFIDTRKFGVGNISLAGGIKRKDHRSHVNGLQMDIRPLRKDGLHIPCVITSSDYDIEATRKLIELFHRSREVKRILFNDGRIPGVRAWTGHDDHFHVELKAAK